MQELTDDELKSLIDAMELSVKLKEDSVLTKDILRGLRELKRIRDKTSLSFCGPTSGLPLTRKVDGRTDKRVR